MNREAIDEVMKISNAMYQYYSADENEDEINKGDTF